MDRKRVPSGCFSKINQSGRNQNLSGTRSWVNQLWDSLSFSVWMPSGHGSISKYSNTTSGQQLKNLVY